MKPIGVLMTEHRLIERMLGVVQREIPKVEAKNEIEPVFIDTVVDFIRIYADRTHHAKEENILFKEVAKKELTREDRALLDVLLNEHDYGRKTVREVVEAKERYLKNEAGALAVILEKLNALIVFYHEHIRKEDELFFPASTGYLSNEEQDAILLEFWESDRKMIHEKYRSVVETWESVAE
jgi:hemerythrin-like domain-containing protein